MGMVSEQAKALMRASENVTALDYNIVSILFQEAADTIESLYAGLEAANRKIEELNETKEDCRWCSRKFEVDILW